MSPSETEPSAERALWAAYEPLHAICYFHPAFPAAMAEAGLTGWWNGYFAGRAAPMGPVGAPVVTATFFGFAPALVARAVPKVWGRITPSAALASRLDTAAAVLEQTVPAEMRADLDLAGDDLARAVANLRFDGRALGAAWAEVEPSGTRLGRLWWAATVLREHRGDGHVIAATSAGLTGLETTLTHVASGLVSRSLLQDNRGWTDEEWQHARERLVADGFVDAVGGLTAAGARLRRQLEDLTDRLASPSVQALTDPRRTVRTLSALSRLARGHPGSHRAEPHRRRAAVRRRAGRQGRGRRVS